MIVEQLTIDATTQSGFAGVPLVELRGDFAGAGVNGIAFGPGSNFSKLRGLVINRFDGSAVSVEARGVTIAGNYLGTDQSGLVALGNFGNGINLVPGLAHGTLIGGLALADRNVISGNGSNGIFSWGVNDTIIQGNYIGIAANGSGGLPNHFQGVSVLSGSNTLIGGAQLGAGNVISGGATTPGVLVEGANQTVIAGNRIGTSADGLTALGSNIGIWVAENVPTGSGSIGTIIGGSTVAERNLISGNQIGIYVSGPATNDTRVLGNWIGLDASGLAVLPNTTGIQVVAGTNLLIGDPTFNSINVISGNSDVGIQISGSDSTQSVVQGNYIGTDPSGTEARPNRVGIVLSNGARNNIIGGTTPNQET